MKALVCLQYGPPEVFQFQEVDMPTPKDNEILIKVHATAVTFGDIKARNFRMSMREFWLPGILLLPARMEMGFNKPKKPILGAETAGEVVAIGKNVTRFQVGDVVFGFTGTRFGANAEYMCMAETGLVTTKPANLNYEEAATVPFAALTALFFIRKAKLQRGQRILINGAVGSIGSFAIQLAKYYGAEVTAVCSTSKMATAKALGADHVIDYTQEDFAHNGKTYDVIFDTVGTTSFEHCAASLTQRGLYLLAAFKMKQLFQMLRTARGDGKKVVCALSGEKVEDLIFLKDLIEAGAIKTIVDRCYPWEQIADAHRYVEQRHKKGHVVITIAS